MRLLDRFSAGLWLVALALMLAPSGVMATDLLPGSGYQPGYAKLALSCDNSRVYPLRVRSVSEAGEIVTGYLGTGYGQVHVRLVPMGNGYRYAGRGIWFDGKRDVAVLYFGPYTSVNCQVLHDGDSAVVAAKG